MSVLNDLRKLLLSVCIFLLTLFLIIPFILLPITSSSHFPIISDAWAATYYVDATNGNDSNPGTETLPWATIIKATATLRGGDIAYVKEGIYREEIDWFQYSGTEQNPITLKVHPSTKSVIIDGEHQRKHGFYLSQSYWVIDGFVIKGAIRAGIEISKTADYNTIKGCKIYDIGPGTDLISPVGVFVNSSYNKILNNEIYDSGGEGIYIGLTPKDYAPDGEPANYNTVKENLIYRCTENGIDIKKNAKFNNIENNTIHSITTGAALAGGQYNTIVYNKIFDSKQSGITLRDNNSVHHNIIYAVKEGIRIDAYFDSNYWNAKSGQNNQLYNNTIYNCQFGIYFDQADQASDNKVKNNVVSQSSSYHIYYANPEGLNNILDYNLYYNSNSINLFYAEYETKTISKWKSYRGQDSHSLTANPLFQDPDNGKFNLVKGSPCIDAGTDVALPYAGSAPDMGAIEFESLVKPSNLRIPNYQ